MAYYTHIKALKHDANKLIEFPSISKNCNTMEIAKFINRAKYVIETSSEIYLVNYETYLYYATN